MSGGYILSSLCVEITGCVFFNIIIWYLISKSIILKYMQAIVGPTHKSIELTIIYHMLMGVGNVHDIKIWIVSDHLYIICCKMTPFFKIQSPSAIGSLQVSVASIATSVCHYHCIVRFFASFLSLILKVKMRVFVYILYLLWDKCLLWTDIICNYWTDVFSFMIFPVF